MAKLINILLQRNDYTIPWGFDIQERHTLKQPVVVSRVLPGAVATHNINAGDVILEIENKKTSNLTNAEIKQIINLPLKDLRLIVMKNQNTNRLSTNERPSLRIIKPIQNYAPKKKLIERDPFKPTNFEYSNRPVAQIISPRKIEKPKDETNEVVKSFNFSQLTKPSPNQTYKRNSCIEKTKNFFENISRSNQYDSNTSLNYTNERPKKQFKDFFVKCKEPDEDDHVKIELSLPVDYYKSLKDKFLSNSPSQFSYSRPSTYSNNFYSSINNLNYENPYDDFNSSKKEEPHIANQKPTFHMGPQFNANQYLKNNMTYPKSYSEYLNENKKKSYDPPRNSYVPNGGRLTRSYSDMALIKNKSQYFKNSEQNYDTIYDEDEYNERNLYFNQFNRTQTPSSSEYDSDIEVFEYAEMKTQEIDFTKTNCDVLMRENDESNNGYFTDYSESTNGSVYENPMFKAKDNFSNVDAILDQYKNKIRSEEKKISVSSIKKIQQKLFEESELRNDNNHMKIDKKLPNNKNEVSKIEFIENDSSKNSNGNMEKQSKIINNGFSKNQNSFAQFEVTPKPEKNVYRNNIVIQIGNNNSYDDGGVNEEMDELNENEDDFNPNELSYSVSTSYFDNWTYEDLRRQQSNLSSPISSDDTNSSSTFIAPPPPPPPGPGVIPSKRLSTEIPDRRIEPPACVQNAMMTKDKKPFTYTPGGLDLSQIKSPRMARRINRNANAEGVGELPKQALVQPPGQLPPSALAAMQPQLPVQVFPTQGVPIHQPTSPINNGVPPPPPPPPPMMNNNSQSPPNNFSNGQPNIAKSPPPPPPPAYQRPDIKIPANPTAMLRQTQGPYRRGIQSDEIDSPKSEVNDPPIKFNAPEPPEVKNKSHIGTLYIPPLTPQESDFSSTSGQNSWTAPTARTVQTPPTAQSPITPSLNKAPTPWLTQRPQPQPSVPAWAQRDDLHSPSVTVHNIQSLVQTPTQIPIQNRVIPIQMESREQNNTQKVHQFQNTTQRSQETYQQQQTNVRIIPIQIEGATSSQQTQQSNVSKTTITENKWNSNGNISKQQQQMSEQMRKMQLQNDDQAFMNKIKNQVDEDTFLHNETDPRYRGGAIPSRAFRMLQTMTDTLPDSMSQMSNASRTTGRNVQNRTQYQQDDGVHTQHIYIPPSEQQVPEPRMYTGGDIPSRSFRILQAMVSPNNSACANTPTSTENLENYANDSYYTQWGGYDPNYPPHPYWNNPYWGYYTPQCFSPCTTPVSSQEDSKKSQTEIDASQYPYWDPYGYYAYYPYHTPIYSPNPFYNHNSDTDTEGAGYSSNEEMAYYASQFAKKCATNSRDPPNIVITPVNDFEVKKNDEKENQVEIKESEKDEPDEENEKIQTTKSGTLLAVKSVSDINVYEDRSICSESDKSSEEDSNDDSTEELDDVSSIYNDEEIPHQLSVIYEESERDSSDQDGKRRMNRKNSETTTISEDDSSATIGVGEYESDVDENAESTVTVKLPLKLNFSRTENNEAVTTILVEPSSEVVETHFMLKSPTPRRELENDDNNNISFTLSIPSKKSPECRDSDATIKRNSIVKSVSIDDVSYETAESDSEVSVSFSLSLKKTQSNELSENTENNVTDENYLSPKEDQQSSSESESESDDSSETSESSEDSSSEFGDPQSNNSSPKEDFNEIEKLKQHFEENIKILLNEKLKSDKSLDKMAVIDTQTSDNKDVEIKIDIKNKISAFENMKNTTPISKANNQNISNKTSYQNGNMNHQNISSDKAQLRRNSSKSTEDVLSDEEVDSGVTSDMSRHISETDTESECFPELRKLSRYQRAATHSRLFKLLQDECAVKNESSSEAEKPDNLRIVRKESLTLPLMSKSIESDCISSDLNSPSSPTVNERLVKELVQSLLKRKKGRCLRHLPLEKLHAAAIRILQEDMDRSDTISSSEDGSTYLSPMHTETVSSSPIQTPQEFYGSNYDDYYNYYNSWARANNEYSDEYDIVPSKTFKLLQENSSGSRKSGAMNGVLAKCPRVLSSKNLPKELQRVTESRESPSPHPESNPPIANEVRTT